MNQMTRKNNNAAAEEAAKNFIMNQRMPKEYIAKKKNKSQLGNIVRINELCWVVLSYVALVNNSVNDIVLLFLNFNNILFFMRVFLFVAFLLSFHRISHGMPPFAGHPKLVPVSVSFEFLNEKL